jgi:hypothetical protein
MTNLPAQPTYQNTTCDRASCHAPKAAGTATLWCDACNLLPICDDCGEAEIDCTARPGGCSYESGHGSHAQDAQAERRQMGIG